MAQKQSKTRSQVIQHWINRTYLVLLPFLFVVLSACKRHPRKQEINNGIENFFLGMTQLLNIFTLGATAVILAIVYFNNGKRSLKTWSIILAVIFLLISLGTLSKIHGSLVEHKFFMIEYAVALIMLIVTFYFATKEPKKKGKASSETSNEKTSHSTEASPEEEIY